ncbi:hypothetical protein Are01nite_38390 [Actinoplanes regularis]|nr:hypothetical protein Are01nite_38390 [Actinoplanes regularis]
MVPVPVGHHIRADTRAAAVHLLPLSLQAESGTRSYANLALHRADLSDIFTGLCADVIAALAAEPEDPLTVVGQVIDGWHELFRSGRQLGVEQLAGLYGELHFLDSLLDLDLDSVGAWHGPNRAPHDFLANGRAAEIKVTVSDEGRPARIHGIDQLVEPPGGGLMLRWMRLDTADAGGRSLPELVAAIADRVHRPREFWHLLAQAGYMIADQEKYAGVRFTVVEEASFRVSDGFPRIVPSSFSEGLPPGLSNVRYTIDLDFAPPPMQRDEVVEFMTALVKS